MGGLACSVEGAALVESGWAAGLAAERDVIRARAPVVHVTGESERERERDTPGVRIPHRVFEVVREALTAGPVLISTPRHGYQLALACARCRQPARCAACASSLARDDARATPECRWCGTEARSWQCPACGGTALRAPVVGSLRTAEEWGRSFPRTRVIFSGGDSVLDSVDDRPALVVATPGAEPAAAGDGYAAGVLLDTWLPLGRPDLRADEEAVRRWFAAAGLVRGAAQGGRVVAVGDPGSGPLQALVRWDPTGFAARELADRRSAQLPPTVRLATLTASPGDLEEAVAVLAVPGGCDVLGPVPVGDDLARAVVRVPLDRGAALSGALQRLSAARSSRKLPAVRVQVDPADLS